jgi:hypothetical protein
MPHVLYRSINFVSSRANGRLYQNMLRMGKNDKARSPWEDIFGRLMAAVNSIADLPH